MRQRPILSSGILLIVVLGVVFALPLIVHGVLPSGRDTPQHLIWHEHFSEQFWSGDPYPRWVLGMNNGLGSPIFYVYNPLSHFCASLLQPIAGMALFGAPRAAALALSLAIALILSGLAAWLWLRSIVPEKAALFAALVYMGMPYHLWADLYVRTALAESWTFVWLPLVLYFSDGVGRRQRFSLAGLALSYCLLLMSHLFTAMIFLPVLLIYVLWSGSEKRLARLLRVAAGLALAVGLSAVYLLPALTHEKHIPAAKLVQEPAYSHEANFLVVDRSIFFWDPLNNRLNWYAAWMAAGAVLLGGLAYAVGLGGAGPRRAGTFWLLISLGTVYLMTPWSHWLWELLPTLQKIQFPWRFHVILTLSTAGLLASALGRWRDAGSWRRSGHIAIVLAAGLMCLAPYLHVWTLYDHKEMAPEFQDELHAGGDYLRRVYARWTSPDLLSAAGLQRMARELPRASVPSGTGRVSVLRWAPGDILLEVESGEDVDVLVAQFYYPTWRAETETGEVFPTKPSSPEGLVRIRTPAGAHRLRLHLPRGEEKLGLAVTLLSLLALGVITFARAAGRSIPGET